MYYLDINVKMPTGEKRQVIIHGVNAPSGVFLLNEYAMDFLKRGDANEFAIRYTTQPLALFEKDNMVAIRLGKMLAGL